MLLSLSRYAMTTTAKIGCKLQPVAYHFELILDNHLSTLAVAMRFCRTMALWEMAHPELRRFTSQNGKDLRLLEAREFDAIPVMQTKLDQRHAIVPAIKSSYYLSR